MAASRGSNNNNNNGGGGSSGSGSSTKKEEEEEKEEKNVTRIASVLGTWTAETRLKTSIGDNELFAYFVVHLMPDPMRGYGCQLDGCTELENRVCRRVAAAVYENENNNNDSSVVRKICVNLQDGVLEWSDLAAFLYFGARVDARLVGVHLEHSTGGWVGPFNLIAARNETAVNNSSGGSRSGGTAFVLDSYTIRYVKTPSTRFLQMPANATLFDQGIFEDYLGATAVNETVFKQGTLKHGEDPYAAHLKTCDNGNVQPILPLYSFDFASTSSTSEKHSNSSSRSNESLAVKLDYKIMTMPSKFNAAYRFMPEIQRIFNADENLGFTVSGPYCYGNDPHRAWTFDFRFDSAKQRQQHSDSVIRLYHGCLRHLPCLPSPAWLLAGGNDSASILYDNGCKWEDGNNGTNGGGGGGGNGNDNGSGALHVVDVSSIVFKIATYFLALALLVSVTCNVQWRRRHARVVNRLRAIHEDEIVATAAGAAAEQQQRGGGGGGGYYQRPQHHHHHHHEADITVQNPYGDMDSSAGAAAAAAAATVQQPPPSMRMLTAGDSVEKNDDTMTEPLLARDKKAAAAAAAADMHEKKKPPPEAAAEEEGKPL